MVWLDEWDAVRFVGRSHRTLRAWRKQGIVQYGRRGRRFVYEKDSLRTAKRVARKRQWEAVGKPGPGRGRWHSDPGVDPVLFVV